MIYVNYSVNIRGDNCSLTTISLTKETFNKLPNTECKILLSKRCFTAWPNTMCIYKPRLQIRRRHYTCPLPLLLHRRCHPLPPSIVVFLIFNFPLLFPAFPSFLSRSWGRGIDKMILKGNGGNGNAFWPLPPLKKLYTPLTDVI